MSEKDLRIFRKFIEDSHSNLSEKQRNLCILLYRNYDELERTSFRSGKRQRQVVKIILENNGKQLELPQKVHDEVSQSAIQRLSRVNIKSFRGFQEEQNFQFGDRFTFVYGRNGTGKSSLVDAIELSLLGSIQEAKCKRIDIDDYIKNIYTQVGIQPQLYGVVDGNTEVKIVANPEEYNFAVIERNRIENFARISAETTSIQQQRLAALVGLDSWNTFVNNFSKEIGSYFPYENELNEQITIQQTQLKLCRDQSEALKKSVQESDQVLKNLLKQFDQTDLNNLSDYLCLKKKHINEKISNIGNTSIVSERYITNIERSQAQYREAQIEYHSHQKNLLQYKSSLSLVDLASAILGQQKLQSNNCPACLSQIYDDQGQLMVPENPYEHAKKIQTQFTVAIELEHKIEGEKTELKRQLRDFGSLLQTTNENLQAASIGRTAVIDRLNTAIEMFFNQKEPILDSAWITNDEFRIIAHMIHTHNEQDAKHKIERKELQSQLNEIIKGEGVFETAKITVSSAEGLQQELDTKIKTAEKNLDDSRTKSVSAKEKNMIFKTYDNTYQGIVKKLKSYTESLPISELSNLNDMTLKIYNLINKYDFTSEQITALQLPLSPNEVIKIKFNVANAPLVDALDVLSEGHIRTLGLAILLAKALKNSQPFIIFDDVVNAIDDDHRKAIAEIVTNVDSVFQNVQWIVTTHGQEFAKQLVSCTSQSMRKDIKEITFKEKELGSDIRSIDKSQNYLALAQEKLEEEDIRGCLADCRREIEVLMIKLWKLYNKRFHVRINIQVDPSNPIPETRNVMDVIRSSFKKQLKGNTAELAVMSIILDKLDYLLDDQGISWFLVNKGTHEEENVEQHDRMETAHLLNSLLIPLDEELTTGIQIKGSMLARRNS